MNTSVTKSAPGKLSRKYCLIDFPNITAPCSSRSLSLGPAKAPLSVFVDDPPSLVKQIVDVLKTQGDENWESKSALNQFLFPDSSSFASLSATDYLKISRQLGTSSTALKFVKQLRSKPSFLPSSAQSFAFQGVFDLASRESGSGDKLWNLSQVSKEMGIPLTINSAVLLVRQFGRAGLIDKSMALYDELAPEMRNSPAIRNVLLEVLVCCGRLEDALKLLDKMLQPDSKFPLNDKAMWSVFQGLLKCAKTGGVNDEELVTLLLMLGGRGVFADSVTLTQLITTMCKGGRITMAWKLLCSLMKLNGCMKAPPFNALLSALGRRNEFEKMNLLLNEMKGKGIKPDVVTCGILINHFCKSQRVDDALELLGKMREGGGELAKPDVVIYNTIIDGLCKAGRLEEGLALMQRMSSSEYCRCRPNRVTYNCVIDGLCTAGEIEKARDLVNQMSKEGIGPDNITMNSLIGGMCRHERISSALKFFSEMKDKGLDGDQVTYTNLINAYCGAGNIDKAIELFDEMKQKLKPDAILYFSLINGLCQCGRMVDASAMMSVMKEAGFRPDISCYNSMISGFCKKNQPDKAYDMLNQMKADGTKPDCITYTILISYFGKSGDFGMVERLWEKMVKAGLEPTVVTYGTLIHAYCLAGDIDKAMEVFREMSKGEGVQPSTVVYNILIASLCKKKEVETALSLFDEMMEAGNLVRPDANTFNAMLKGLMEMNLLEKAFELMDMMIDQGCNPDYVTLEILTKWLPAVGETDRLRSFVLQCQEESNKSGIEYNA